MIRSAAGKVMWVGRATVFLVGLAVLLALVFGAASTVEAHTGNKGFFHLGHRNVSQAVSKLVKRGAGPALNLRVGSGPPLAVNSSEKVNNLNADQLDGMEPGKLPGSIASTATFSGYPGSSFTVNATYKFVGPTATVTTSSTQRLVGAGQVPLGLSSGTRPLTYGLCYQPSDGNGGIINFVGGNFSVGELTTARVSWAAAASRVPGAGTWKVGFCVRSTSVFTIDDVNFVNGWVQVVNQ